MALTETIEYDKIEVVGQYKAVQVRKATVIKKDGAERFDILTEIGRIVSVALQHGTPLEELAACATYHSSGAPSTVVGCVFDRLKEIS